MKILKFIIISVLILGFIALSVGGFNLLKDSTSSSEPSDDVVVVPDDAPTDDLPTDSSDNIPSSPPEDNSDVSDRYVLTADDYQLGTIFQASDFSWEFTISCTEHIVSCSIPLEGLEIEILDSKTANFYFVFLDSSNNLIVGSAFLTPFFDSVDSSFLYPSGTARVIIVIQPVDVSPDSLNSSFISSYTDCLIVSYSLS